MAGAIFVAKPPAPNGAKLMRILAINSGSSSIKFRLLDMGRETPLVSGLLERIGETGGRLVYRRHTAAGAGDERQADLSVADHAAGLERIFALLENGGAPASQPSFQAVGHRVVHGGLRFRSPVRIDEGVVGGIRGMIPLAPLHNAVNLAGIEAALRLCPRIPQVAVFDTAFFRTLPPHACQYALPYDITRQYPIRRYGFHGISHRYVASQAAGFLRRPLAALRLITLHLGNGASAAAIRDGMCIDTSMGMTPLEGLIMGTRCGDVDPAVPVYLARNLGLNPDEIETLLNQDSGMKGLCGHNDMREVHRLAQRGDERARLAIDMYCYRIIKYVGAYYAALGGLDALVFTAGVGENDPLIRQSVCQGLSGLGISLDPRRNRAGTGDAVDISGEDSRVKVLVIPTDEELEIARQTASVIGQADAACASGC